MIKFQSDKNMIKIKSLDHLLGALDKAFTKDLDAAYEQMKRL